MADFFFPYGLSITYNYTEVDQQGKNMLMGVRFYIGTLRT